MSTAKNDKWKGKKTICVALATIQPKTANFLRGTSQACAQAGRGLAYFLGRRFAVPRLGCDRFAPFDLVAGVVQERAKIKKPNSAAVILGVLLGSLTHGFAQTNIQIIGVAPTIEQAIQLTWTSASNHTYEIDEADALATNADGSTAWNMLYNDYPSQGTNTFWLDTGNYVQAPPIVHPRFSPMRFYRIIDSGLDTTSDEPTVSIVTPTNGFVATGNLTTTGIMRAQAGAGYITITSTNSSDTGNISYAVKP